jgi:SSS family solute:Na+ symporter
VTGVLAVRNRDVVKNMAILPRARSCSAFSLCSGSWPSHLKPVGGTKGHPDTNTIVPWLFHNMFPTWFAGIAFGAIAISALVPAALMAIAAANTFTRDIYRSYFRPQANDREEAFVSKLVSIIIKFGARAVKQSELHLRPTSEHEYPPGSLEHSLGHA